MTASELQRKLLYRGHEEIGEFFRNSPFNRKVYNVLLTYGPKEMSVTELDIFNEAYYQCVRVNYDVKPGTDLASRYLEEEALWLGDRKAAMVVFSIVWGLLRCKDDSTFNEQCFVDQFYHFLGRGDDERLAYIIIKFTAGDRMLPPRVFQPMPTPVVELQAEPDIDNGDVWKTVTNNFSQKAIERYLELYETPDEQLSLLSIIETAYQHSDSKNHRVSFTQLRNGIKAGRYHKAATQVAEYESGMSLTYKEELEQLKKKYQDLEFLSESRLAEQKYNYEGELKELREQLEQKDLKAMRENNPRALLFTFTEMTEIVKARFSKAGAEEFTNMLYNLAAKHGYLDEDFCRTIDDIVPAVLAREKGNTTVHIPTAHQVNINPGQVTNQFQDNPET